MEDLGRIEFLLESLLKIEVKKILASEIADEKHQVIYELTGEKKRDEIVNETGLSGGTISGLWAKWEKLGILQKNGKTYQKIVE